MLRRQIAAALLLVTAQLQAGAQTTNSREHLSGFVMTSFTYKFSPRWMGYLELQRRSIEKFNVPDYYEIKGGAGYNINSKNQAFVGTGRYVTYKERSISQREQRLWLQYTFSANIDRIKLDNRLRAEQRFFDMPQKDTHATTQRFRYRLNASLPIGKEKITAKTFFANAFDEVFAGPETRCLKETGFMPAAATS